MPFNDPTRRSTAIGPRGVRYRPQRRHVGPLASGHLASFDRRNARARSMVRPRPAGTARRAGRCIHCPDRNSKASTTGQRAKRATTPGWTSSTRRSGQERADGNRQPVRLAAALVDGKFVTLRVPYPMGFYAKGLDGRIDDPGGAAGRAAACGRPTRHRAPFHMEGGKGTTSKVVNFQVRPDPLAR